LKKNEYYIYLDILRAYFAFAILFYHLGVLQGGYLAVCSFFTISGYLSCRTLDRHEKVNIRSYYFSRIKTIYVPLVIVVSLSVLFVTSLPGHNWVSLKPEVTSILLGYNNFWQMAANLDYFAGHKSSPFMHLWYISILMQFSVAFPLFYIPLRFIRRKYGSRTVSLVSFLLAMVFTAVFIRMCITTDTMTAYYNSIARAFSLFIGVAMWYFHEDFGRFVRHYLSRFDAKVFIGIFTVILSAVFVFVGVSNKAFIAAMIAVSILSCLILELCTDLGARESSTVGKIAKPVSDCSYELYLVQYPVLYIYQFYKGDLDGSLGGVLVIGVISFVLAYILHIALYPPKRKAPEHKKEPAPAPQPQISKTDIGVRDLESEFFASIMAELSPNDRPAYADAAPAPEVKPEPKSRKKKNYANHRSVIVGVLLFLLTIPGLVIYIREPNRTAEMNALAEEMAQNELELQQRQQEYANKLAREKDELEAASKAYEEGIENLGQHIYELNMTTIGDSVMLGASTELCSRFINCYCDAVKSRSPYKTDEVVNNLLSLGVLGDPVVIHMGTNGTFTASYWNKVMDLCGDRDVFWIGISNDSMFHVNDMLRSQADTRDNAYYLDWPAFSKDHHEYFGGDNIHLTTSGKKAYTQFIYEALYDKYLADYYESEGAAIEAQLSSLEADACLYRLRQNWQHTQRQFLDFGL